MFIGAGANLVLAPLYIFVFDMGIKGAAIATDIAMVISMIFVMAHFFSKKSTLRFVKGIYRLRWKIIWGIVAVGAAPCFVNIAGSAINGIINTALYKYGGDVSVAAVGIFITYTSLLSMIVVGICQGMQPIVGYNYGAKRLDRLNKTFWLSVGAGSLVTATGWAIGQFFPEYIAKMFTDDIELINATANGLSISMTMFWLVGFQIVATTLFQSIGMAGKSIFLSLVRQVIFLIPFLFIFPCFYGLNGVWASFPVSDVCATVVAGLMVLWQLRQIKKQMI